MHPAKYTKIADDLKAKLREPGSEVPSEWDIADNYNVARNTARRALGVLYDEGLIEKRRGRGHYVAGAEPAPVAGYEFLARILKERYAKLPPGSQVPSEWRISEEYGMARTSVRAATNVLKEQGVIRAIHGRGTFTV